MVLGLGLIGQLAARLAVAAGCEVAGIDPAEQPRRVAAGSGVLALDECGDATTDRVLSWSRGRGADAVLVCAAGRSSEAVMRVPALCRDRAAVVIVGDVGLQLNRTPFYERELSLRFARSYGPGRYDPSYEAWGVDLPGRPGALDRGTQLRGRARPAGQRAARGRRPGHAYLRHRRGGRRLPADRAAHRAVPGHPADLPGRRTADGRPAEGARGHDRHPAIGWAGAGAFSTGTLLPAFRAAGFDRFVAVASASGLSARRAAERHGFEKAVSGADALIDDPDIEVVVIATPHDTHAELAARALAAGRHVWCEKPLALTLDELDAVRRPGASPAASSRSASTAAGPPPCWPRSGRSPGSRRRSSWCTGSRPGRVPDGHWYHDRRQGGGCSARCATSSTLRRRWSATPIEDVAALPGGAARERPLDDAAVSLRFADGSLAAIAYGSAEPLAGKEWIEVQAACHRVVIDDFRSAKADGKTVWKGRQDKGHRPCASRVPRGGGGRGGPADRGHAGHDARHDPCRRGTGK